MKTDNHNNKMNMVGVFLEYKKGKIGCSVDTLYRISVVLGITIDKLFEDIK